MSNPETVAYLVEFYEVAQIKAFWKQVGDALLSRSSTTVHLTSSTVEGASASGLVLSTPAEQQAFMASCREALRQLNEEDQSTDPASLGHSTDFSRRPVTV